MKSKYAILLTALLSMGACGAPTGSPSTSIETPSSSSEVTSESSSTVEESSSSSKELTPQEKYKLRTEYSHLPDPYFKNGFRLMSPESPTAFLEGTLDYNGAAEKDHYNPDADSTAYWTACQWWTPFNFITSDYSYVEGVHRYQNESRLMEVNTEKGSLKMALNSGTEYEKLYGGKMPTDKSWSHFLIQQSFPADLHIPVCEYDDVRVRFDITIEKANYVGKEPIKYAHECAQLLFYFSMSDGNGNAMWFGVPIFDTRYDNIAEYHAMDVGFAGATNKLIHSIPSKGHMGVGPVEMNKKYSIDLNVREEIQNAYVRAVTEGIFNENANWANLKVNYMNFGWELPGEYDVSCVLENLDILAFNY